MQWCITAGDAPQVMHRRWCTAGDAPQVMYRRWCLSSLFLFCFHCFSLKSGTPINPIRFQSNGPSVSRFGIFLGLPKGDNVPFLPFFSRRASLIYYAWVLVGYLGIISEGIVTSDLINSLHAESWFSGIRMGRAIQSIWSPSVVPRLRK